MGEGISKKKKKKTTTGKNQHRIHVIMHNEEDNGPYIIIIGHLYDLRHHGRGFSKSVTGWNTTMGVMFPVHCPGTDLCGADCSVHDVFEEPRTAAKTILYAVVYSICTEGDAV
jgi:hypothetical protein